MHRRQEPAECIDTSATLKGNFAWHITRAFHLAGRCVGCDECTRVCPAGIDLRLLNLSLAKAAEEQFRLPRRRGSARPSRSSAPTPLQDKEEFHPMSEIISKDDLRRLVDEWIGRGQARRPARVGSSPDSSSTRRWPRRPSCCWTASSGRRNSIKEFVFPRHEKLYGYRLEGKQIELLPTPSRRPPSRSSSAPGPAMPPRCRSSTTCSTGTSRTSSTTAAAS